MEIAPELQFRHYTLGEAQLPVDAFVQLEGVAPTRSTICCDLDAHVFNPDHTDPRVVEALRGTHWIDLREFADAARRASYGPAAAAVVSAPMPTRRRPVPQQRPEAAPRPRSRRPGASGSPRRCSPTCSRRPRRRGDVRRRAGATRAAGGVDARRRPTPRPGSGRTGGARRGRAAAPARTSSSTPTCPARPRATCSRWPASCPTAASRSSRRPTGRRTRSRSRRRVALRAGLRAGQRRAVRGARAVARLDAPNLVDDVDTVADLERLAAGWARARSACSRRCGSRRQREGRSPLRRRRRRALPARPARRRRAGGRDDRRQRRRRPRGARPPRLARPRQHPLHARRALPTRSAAGAAPTRAGARSRPSPQLGGEAWFRLGDRDLGLHLVRTELLRAGASASEATARIAAALGSRVRAAARDRRPACARSSRRPPARSRSRRGSSPAATATRSTPCTTPARRSAEPAPGVVEALDAADVIAARAEQPVRLDRPDPRGRGDPRGARAAPRAVRRRQPADRRPRGQGPGRPDARPARGRHDAGARRRLLSGADRRARRRRGGRAGRAARPGSAPSSRGR